MEQVLVARQETAVALGISLRTLDHLIADGAIPTRKVGRRILILKSTIERFARSGCEVSTTKNSSPEGEVR